MNEILRRLGMLWNRRRWESELDEEIRDHLARRAEDLGADGARRRFGNVTLVREESRQAWTGNALEQFAQDVRYAWRSMSANQLFTVVAVVSLALGIGANTAIYSLMDAVMLRSLPVSHPEELVILNWRAKGEAPVVRSHWGENYEEPGGGVTSPNLPYPWFEQLRDQKVLSSLIGHASAGRLNLLIDGHAETAEGQYVTGDFFAGLGVPALAGRVLNRDDDQPGATLAVVMSEEYWRSRFGGDRAVVGAVVGKRLQINGLMFTVAGVAAAKFLGVSPDARPRLFLPMASIAKVDRRGNWLASMQDRHFYWIELMGRLKPGVPLATAQAELAGRFRSFVESTATKDRERSDLPALSLQAGGAGVDSLRRRYAQPLWILMAMVGLILLIACANLANLLLARAAGRSRELAVRLSLGAGRFRVVRQLLTESLLLALAGGLAGLGVAAFGIRLIGALLASGDEPFTVSFGLDWPVLAFTLLVAVVATLLFGLVPAIQSTRVDVTPALRASRSGAGPSGGRRFGLSQVLVVAQIAISLLLVVAASLFVRTLANLRSVQLGFNAEQVLLFSLDATHAGYQDAALKAFYADLESRLRALPGVRSATTTDLPLVGGWSSQTPVSGLGIPKPPEGQRGPSSAYVGVGGDFFETMEIPILAGRPLGRRDVAGAPLVAVVNQVFANRYFPGQNVIGRRITLNSADMEIVGVAKTARYNSLKRDIPPVTYLPWLQAGKNLHLREIFFEVRAVGDPLALSTSVRQLVRQASPLVPVMGLTTQTRRIEQTIRQERAFAQLSTVFGALALLMAVIGLYGTMAYAVARRTSEIGIRMALGAARGSVVWMVLRQVLTLAGLGLAFGFAIVSQATAAVRSFLFGLAPNDPVALGWSAAILLASALMAGFWPARRASRIDPVVALRHE